MIFSTLPSQQPFPYTWATKPPAAGNAGLRIRISDLRNIEFESDGAYWRPVGGIVRIPTPDVFAITVTNQTLAEVAGTKVLDGIFQELMSTPGATIRGFCIASRDSPSTSQPCRLFLGIKNVASGGGGGGGISLGSASPLIVCDLLVSPITYSPLSVREIPANFQTNQLSNFNQTIAGGSLTTYLSLHANVGGAGETMRLNTWNLEYKA